MSTSRIHMEQLALAQISYDSIDHSIRTLDTETGSALLAITAGHGQQLVKVYAAVRPLLKAVAVLPLLPATWRAALQLFLTALDAFLASSDFKAGKDLSIDEVQP